MFISELFVNLYVNVLTVSLRSTHVIISAFLRGPLPFHLSSKQNRQNSPILRSLDLVVY